MPLPVGVTGGWLICRAGTCRCAVLPQVPEACKSIASFAGLQLFGREIKFIARVSILEIYKEVRGCSCWTAETPFFLEARGQS